MSTVLYIQMLIDFSPSNSDSKRACLLATFTLKWQIPRVILFLLVHQKMDARILLLSLTFILGFFTDNTSGWWLSRRRRRRCSPSNCQVTGWSSWSRCTQPCGSSGVQSRQRSVTRVQSCGGGCYHLSETRGCNRVCCPVNCAWSWGNWGACQGCGVGRRSRNVVVSTNPSCGGAACPGKRSETQSCNTGR